MILSRRTGWIRLGIIVSLAWFVCVSIYAIFEHKSAKTYYTAIVTESYKRNKSQNIPEGIRIELRKNFRHVEYLGGGYFS